MNRKLERLLLALLSTALLLMAMTACATSSNTGTEPPAEGTSAPQSPDGQAETSPNKPLKDKQPSNPQDEEFDHAYDELVEHFYALAADPYAFENADGPGEFGVVEVAGAMEDNALDALGYTIEDLSGDGVPELAVGTLPECGGQVNPYGGQVHAVYTLVDGQPQFVFEGWYRNSYAYMGDGRFFYYGSGGAAETGMGVVVLTGDGTALECESFLFTQLGGDGEIHVFYNETRSWDPAQSEESEMTLDDFWALNPAGDALPLTSFADYAAERGYDDSAAGAPVRVQWAELLPGLTDYEEFVADDGEYSANVLFTSKRTVRDFELMRLTIREVYDDGTVSYAPEPVYSLERLTPECPLMVRMTFPGDIPAWGISYVDESGDGATHRLAVEISGEDGSLLLLETY